MPANRLHLVRHGEVHNPDGILYGRLPRFALSERGHQMARLAAQELKNQGRPISALISSPLLRTRESAEHIQAELGGGASGLELAIDERLIEPTNIFEGSKVSLKRILVRPGLWFHLRNPLRPSWGEPYQSISARMIEAMDDAAAAVKSGDVVLVSHQLPIWATHLKIDGKQLAHNPRKRRCSLSSITSFEKHGGRWVEVDYREPAAKLLRGAIDQGAV